jgi:hypothetical protein
LQRKANSQKLVRTKLKVRAANGRAFLVTAAAAAKVKLKKTTVAVSKK